MLKNTFPIAMSGGATNTGTGGAPCTTFALAAHSMFSPLNRHGTWSVFASAYPPIPFCAVDTAIRCCFRRMDMFCAPPAVNCAAARGCSGVPRLVRLQGKENEVT